MVDLNEQDIERLKSIKEKTKRVKYTERSLELVLDYVLIRSFANYSGVDLQDTSGADMENASQVILEKIAIKYGNRFSHIKSVIHQNIIYLETDLREYSDEVADFIKILSDVEITEEKGELAVYSKGGKGNKEEIYKAIEGLEQAICEKEQIEKIIEEQIEKINFELDQCLPDIVNQIIVTKESKKHRTWLQEKLSLFGTLDEAINSYVNTKTKDRFTFNLIEEQLIEAHRECDFKKSIYEQLVENYIDFKGLMNVKRKLQTTLLECLNAKTRIEDLLSQEEIFNKEISRLYDKDIENGEELTKFLKKSLSKNSNEGNVMAVIQSVIKQIENNSFMTPKGVLENMVIPAWNDYTLLPIEK
mgnify:CR=1 FL=1|jgi:hypothetical protein